MKDPLEEALEALRPKELEPDLMARLTAARSRLSSSSEKAGPWWRRWLLPVAAGVAAAWLALLWLRPVDPPPLQQAQAVNLVPVERSDYLLAAREVGMLVGPNQRPYRVVEIEWLERDVIRGGPEGTSVLVDTKRREVVPVALEVF
jgi:hypothetical protein